MIDECLAKPDRPDALLVEHALTRGQLTAMQYPVIRSDFHKLGAGEQSALELACQRNCHLMVDDKRARLLARQYDVSVIGVPGVLLLAKQNGLIPEVQPLLHELRLCGYFLNDDLVQEVIRLAGE